MFKCSKIWPTGNRWNHVLFTWPKNNKISAASKTVATAGIALKICKGQPPNNVLTVLRTSSKSVLIRWSYIRTRRHRFCPVEYFHDSPEPVLRIGRIITFASVNQFGGYWFRWQTKKKQSLVLGYKTSFSYRFRWRDVFSWDDEFVSILHSVA